jgi:hypothetical protein
MKLPAATAILVIILVGAVTNAQSPTTNQDPAIQIVPQEARTSIPGAPTNFTGRPKSNSSLRRETSVARRAAL